VGFLIYSIMKYLKTFENHDNNKSTTLIIVDVQKSFSKFFTEMYLYKLKEYCKQFSNVYQIWDNHVEGKNVDKDYLYHEDPEIPIHDDLYHFPNQKDLIEKRYNYDVDADFYKKILDKQVYNDIKNKEKNKSLKIGDYFPTKEGTIIVYIANHHRWFHCPKKLYDILIGLKDKEVTIVGGADSECAQDIYITSKSIGVNIKRDHRFIFSASHCPIK
jgi:hypothetical protein